VDGVHYCPPDCECKVILKEISILFGEKIFERQSAKLTRQNLYLFLLSTGKPAATGAVDGVHYCLPDCECKIILKEIIILFGTKLFERQSAK